MIAGYWLFTIFVFLFWLVYGPRLRIGQHRAIARACGNTFRSKFSHLATAADPGCSQSKDSLSALLTHLATQRGQVTSGKISLAKRKV